jgi:hypothetical protein
MKVLESPLGKLKERTKVKKCPDGSIIEEACKLMGK